MAQFALFGSESASRFRCGMRPGRAERRARAEAAKRILRVLEPEANGSASPTLFRWAGVRARSDSPSVYELVEAGWVPVAHDTRYGSTLCMIEAPRPRQFADEDPQKLADLKESFKSGQLAGKAV